jgi:hypothetical protein
MNGRIDRPGDWDVFRFQGRAGEAIVAEVYARRLDSPLDSVLKLTDAKGTQLAFNDDYDDPGAGLETHHADSRILTTLPANGTYYLYLGDAQQKGGPEYAYRLRIGAPRPDFDLRVTPSSINVSGGMTVPITVHALRKDGFSGDIALALKGAPKGFTLIGGLLPAGRDEVRLTLTVPPQPRPEPLSLSLEGRATIQGHQVSRLAVPAEDMMQAFAYRHLVPANDLKVAVRRGAMLRVPIQVSSQEQPLEIPAGGTARFQVRVPTLPGSLLTKVQYELSEPPEGVELRNASPGRDGTEIVLQCDAAKAKPGLKGNLIVNISAERVAQAQTQSKRTASAFLSAHCRPCPSKSSRARRSSGCRPRYRRRSREPPEARSGPPAPRPASARMPAGSRRSATRRASGTAQCGSAWWPALPSPFRR